MDATDKVAQINIKIPQTLADCFKTCLESRRESQREVLERCIESYCAQVESRAVIHLDGSMCPLNKLINDLAHAAKSQMAGAPMLHKTINSLSDLTPNEVIALKQDADWQHANDDLNDMCTMSPDMADRYRRDFAVVELKIARKLFKFQS